MGGSHGSTATLTSGYPEPRATLTGGYPQPTASLTGGYIPPRATLTGGGPSLTAPGASYTTVILPAAGVTLTPQRPTHSAAVTHTRPPSGRPGYQYLPPQGQASDKVATYVRPESGGRADRGLISPREAGGGADLLSSNLVDVGPAAPVPGGLAGPGVEQQGPQTELQQAASTDRLVLQEAADEEPGLEERLRQLGLLRFLALVRRAGLEKLLQSRGEWGTPPRVGATEHGNGS